MFGFIWLDITHLSTGPTELPIHTGLSHLNQAVRHLITLSDSDCSEDKLSLALAQSACEDTGKATIPKFSGNHRLDHIPNSIQMLSVQPDTKPKGCAGCNRKIKDRYLLKALDKYWHEDCLKCACCDCRLGEVGSTLYTKANLILCRRDYLRRDCGSSAPPDISCIVLPHRQMAAAWSSIHVAGENNCPIGTTVKVIPEGPSPPACSRQSRQVISEPSLRSFLQEKEEQLANTASSALSQPKGTGISLSDIHIMQYVAQSPKLASRSGNSVDTSKLQRKRLFGVTGNCAACSKLIPAFEMVMRAKDNVYHLDCFACQLCNQRFCVGDKFFLKNNMILCQTDYEEGLMKEGYAPQVR
ncbi:hypothetical protein Q9233_002543 [Columba guinea]|nr:hypothetical protein Q9233_002543 [Columba guinea]